MARRLAFVFESDDDPEDNMTMKATREGVELILSHSSIGFVLNRTDCMQMADALQRIIATFPKQD